MKANKKIARVMAVMLLSGLSLNTFAGELPVLTVEKAVASAVNTDNSIKVYEKQIVAAKEVADDTPDISSTSYAINRVYVMKYGQDINYTKDAIAYDVTKLYNEMALLKEKIAFNEEKVAFEEKKFRETEIRYNNHMISKADYDTAVTNLENLRNKQVDLKAQLEEDRVKFNTKAKFDVNYYTLEGNFEAEEYTYIGNIQRYFDESVEQMQKYDREIAEIQDRRVIYDTAGPYNEFQSGAFYSGKANSAVTLNSLEVSKKNKIDALNTTYTSIISTWQKIKDTEVTIAETQKKLAAQKIRLANGYASAMSIEELEMQIKELELTIKECKVNYNAMVAAIKTPWVSFY